MTRADGHRELWLVRHGETPASKGRTLAGWTDVPLTPHGEEQAAALRPLLAREQFDGVWSSDLRRTVTRFEGFVAPGGESFEGLPARVLSFLDGLAAGRHLVFTHGGVVRLLSREVGEDHFVSTGTLLVVDWDDRRLLSRKDGEGEASGGLPVPAVGREEER
jgi:probable phosphoglycerate mutase